MVKVPANRLGFEASTKLDMLKDSFIMEKEFPEQIHMKVMRPHETDLMNRMDDLDKESDDDFLANYTNKAIQ
ncbi:hypothetical protein CEXT_297611 [Caerostris extrusa]|uniref:Uncharacterized protein n=1 Tax=Caerostris extrusa TaxID=172846 RepID=A0AAV4MXG8_CAEEX|nr:hypothetical protein CEXT_297611 [Caerostris extrusa]